MSAPAVSVIMAVHDGARYLASAVDSILGQTWRDLELIVVDDGSTDATPAVLDAIADDRLVRIRNEQNRGLAASLNTALEAARAGFIARMDADDLAVPARLERQLAFLEANPEVGIVGSRCSKIGPRGEDLGSYDVPLSDTDIRWRSLLGNPFAHPTVVLRRAAFGAELRYDASLRATQDYELWSRLLPRTRAANLQEPLIAYRIGAGVTAGRRAEQLATEEAVARRILRREVPAVEVPAAALRPLRVAFIGGIDEGAPEPAEVPGLCALYLDLLDAFLDGAVPAAEAVELRRREAVRVARALRAHGWPKGSGALLRRLLRHPAGAEVLLRGALRSLAARVRR